MRVLNVRVRRPMADALAEAVEAAREVERRWWTERRKELARRAAAEDLPVAARNQLIDALHVEFDRLREAGTLVGTRTAYVLPALRGLLDERGWTARRWRPVPRQRRGRPWGTHDEVFDARVALHLPEDVGELLVRACYWTSRPAVAKLQAWYDQHGDHWRGHLHNPAARWRGAGPSHADLRERELLIGQVITTGKVLRQAIECALTKGGKVET
ncbi:hypothetical protein [Micromonospora sediminicola]|uniref:hypothetical protein n=1 Tax=Micromonospora sediminicola TaxID=946078 RepID=UPI0037983CFF